MLRESSIFSSVERVSTVQIVEGDASTQPSTADILICANSRQKGLSTLYIHYLGCSLNLCTKKWHFYLKIRMADSINLTLISSCFIYPFTMRVTGAPQMISQPVSSIFPCSALPSAPTGRPGMSDVSHLSGISGLSFDSTLLSPVLFFCLVLLPFLSYLFLPAGLSSKLFPENSSIFFIKR